jgi:hypothetical protein
MNPYDILVSCLETKGEYFKQPTFKDFIRYVCITGDGYINPHAQSQVAFIGDQRIDKYVLFDSLQEDFKELGITIPFHHNKTVYNEPPPWTEELRQQVQERYHEDFKLYDYCKQLSTLPRRGY